ncbi:hypothetical protein AB0G71_23270 [Streptomyces sp. NPDC020403]|uniref:hypothetical protein n=1 Tax=unclassified Streptomyces TaxID=2593676 RepID=UPI0033F8EBEE
MRQLSARVRRAAVTALTIAVSTGCMSVGHDAGQPAPPRPSGQRGESAHPDGATGRGTGRAGSGGGRAEAQSERDVSRGPEANAHPGGSPAAPASPAGSLPESAPGQPEPTRGGQPPLPEPSVPEPGEPPPPPSSPEPPPSPPPVSPEPSQPPPEPPSASPAGQFRSAAAGPSERVEVWATPEASPQVAPV